MWPFKKHKADLYFKFKRASSQEGWAILYEAKRIRHKYPNLSGPELVRLVYWGASGAVEND